jgi:O-antigen/teichoic acid export membrane protein
MAQLLRNAGFYSLGNILPKLVNFVLIPIYTRVLGPDQYGVVTALASIEGLLLICMSLATERSLYRIYYDFPQAERSRYLTTVSITITASSLAIMLLLLCGGPFIFPRVFKAIPFAPYYPMLLLSCFFNGFSIVPAALFVIRGQSGRFIMFNAGRFLLGVVSSLTFLFIFRLGALGILMGTMIANLLFVPVSLLLIFRNAVRPLFSRPMFAATVSFSLPMLPSLLAAWVINLSNRIIIGNYFSLNE